MATTKGRFTFSILFWALLLQGCSLTCSNKRKEMSPEQVVESYLNIALNMTEVSQRDELIVYTVGALREAIEGADKSVIKQNFIDRHYNLKRFTLVERRDITPREVEITFQLEYNELEKKDSKPDESALVKTENTVSVIRKQGYWFIRDVIGAKTSIDFALTSENHIKVVPGTSTENQEEE